VADQDKFGGRWIQKSTSRTCVLFVHGILSEGEKPWTHPNGTSWPRLVAQEKELAGGGVYLFSYRSDVLSHNYNLGDVVDSLREFAYLDGLWDMQRLIFVCHSMGGIVARRFVVVHQTELIERKCVIGLFLVASPSLGSKDANMLRFFARMVGNSQAEVLKFTQRNVWLNDLDRDFINLKEDRRLSITGKELVEDEPIVLKKWFGLRRQVVEPFSAARYFGESFKVPGSDHLNIATPKDEGAVQHRQLKRFIQEIAYPGPPPVLGALPIFEIGTCTEGSPFEMECTGEIVRGLDAAIRVVEEIELDTTPADSKRFDVRVEGMERIRGYLATMGESVGPGIEERHKLRMALRDWEDHLEDFRTSVEFVLWNHVFRRTAHIFDSKSAAETICGLSIYCFGRPYDSVTWFLWYDKERKTRGTFDVSMRVEEFMEKGFYEKDYNAVPRFQGLKRDESYELDCFIPRICRRHVLPPLLIYVAKRKKEGDSQATVEKYLDVSRWHWSVDDPYRFVFAKGADEG
jgi:pimeloyl-ACP methyl ester carboxylesterase